MSCLRAYDLGALQQTCKAFADPELTDRVVKYVSGGIYPKSLTAGFTTAQIGGTTAASSRGNHSARISSSTCSRQKVL